MPIGYLAFVLHSHVPYVRQAGRIPQGEEPLLGVAADTHIPLLNALYALRAERRRFRLTVGITPILAEQLADEDVLLHLEQHLLDGVQRAAGDVRRFEKDGRRAGEGTPAAHMLYLARFYLDWQQNLLDSFRERFKRDLIGAYRLLQEEGLVEIVTSAATHAYLPLLPHRSAIYAQLRTGVSSYLHHFGRLPRGLWLPECGYRPGLEEYLAELNIRYTFVDTQAIEQGHLSGKTLGDVFSPSDTPSRRRPPMPTPPNERPPEHSVLQPYRVQHSNVAVYGRDDSVGQHVWSASEGYPGDFAYRDSLRRDELSGLRYWRLCKDEEDMEKGLYDPYKAFHRAHEHADHFVELLRGRLSRHLEQTGQPGIVVAAYDTALFGHWWFEGIAWLKEVLRQLGNDPNVQLVTADEHLQLAPPTETIALPESSWGWGGDHATWQNQATEWMWPLLDEAERRMEDLVARFPDANNHRLEVLKQAAREILLLQSSEWPAWMSDQQTASYAAQRFREHLERFNRLAILAEQGALSEQESLFLQECQRLDNPFLYIDYRTFAAH